MNPVIYLSDEERELYLHEWTPEQKALKKRYYKELLKLAAQRFLRILELLVVSFVLIAGSVALFGLYGSHISSKPLVILALLGHLALGFALFGLWYRNWSQRYKRWLERRTIDLPCMYCGEKPLHFAIGPSENPAFTASISLHCPHCQRTVDSLSWAENP